MSPMYFYLERSPAQEPSTVSARLYFCDLGHNNPPGNTSTKKKFLSYYFLLLIIYHNQSYHNNTKVIQV